MTSFVIVLAALTLLAEATDVCKEDAACMNKENAQTCKKFHAQCGELMLIMESCPLQFSCPKTMVSEDVCNEDAPCMNTENAQTCKKYQAECGELMISRESCPLQFTCPKIRVNEDVCNENAPCMNNDNAQICKRFQAQCGELMLIKKSCPRQFSCPKDTVNEDVCIQDAPCMNAENAQVCKKYQAECGDQMLVMESCPLQFGCPQDAGNVITVTTDVCNEDDAKLPCMDKESAQECKEYYAQCGDMMVVTSECPPKFSCHEVQGCACGEACEMESGASGICMEDSRTCTQPLVAPNCSDSMIVPIGDARPVSGADETSSDDVPSSGSGLGPTVLFAFGLLIVLAPQ